jgi:5-methylcytosine-specific restriction endonuclease McrA
MDKMESYNIEYMARLGWLEISEKIKRRDKYTCQSCGFEESKFLAGKEKLNITKKPYSFVSSGNHKGILHVHHKIPISFGGSDESDNLITLCPSCHLKMERRIERWFRMAKKNLPQGF